MCCNSACGGWCWDPTPGGPGSPSITDPNGTPECPFPTLPDCGHYEIDVTIIDYCIGTHEQCAHANMSPEDEDTPQQLLGPDNPELGGGNGEMTSEAMQAWMEAWQEARYREWCKVGGQCHGKPYCS